VRGGLSGFGGSRCVLAVERKPLPLSLRLGAACVGISTPLLTPHPDHNQTEERKKDLELLESAAAPDEGGGGRRTLVPRAQDADDADADGSDDSSSSDSDDDDDDEAELMAELERIRGERAAEVRASKGDGRGQGFGRAQGVGGGRGLGAQRVRSLYDPGRCRPPLRSTSNTTHLNLHQHRQAERRAAEEEARREKEKEEALRTGNPLLAIAGGSGSAQAVDFGVKRRWDEDVVFKNTTRGEAKAPRRFINDTVRSDFHKRFLQRYVR